MELRRSSRAREAARPVLIAAAFAATALAGWLAACAALSARIYGL